MKKICLYFIFIISVFIVTRVVGCKKIQYLKQKLYKSFKCMHLCLPHKQW